MREALFAWLGELTGVRALDLFAGSGALGIEALSRGAAHVIFVERSAAVAAVLRANLAALGLVERSRVLRGDAAGVVRRIARLRAAAPDADRDAGGASDGGLDLVLADPPYADLAAAIGPLRALVTSGILAPRATIVLEASRHQPPPSVEGLAPVDERRYGDTVIYRFEPAGDAQQGGAASHAESAMSRDSDPKRLALFPASFDPVTNGHLDLIHRARAVFDELVVAVARNVAKQGTFSVDERIELLAEVLGGEPGIRVTAFDGLLVDYARRIGAHVLIRGLRAVSDFEYEFEMALMNRHLYPEIETLFMMTSQKYFYVSSSRLKELVRFGSNVEEFVPPVVASRLKEKLGGGRA